MYHDEKPVDRSTPDVDDTVSPFFVLSHIASHLVIALDESEAQEDAALTEAKRLSKALLDELLSLYDKRS